MNSFRTSKLFSALVALVMIAAAIIVPLSGSIAHAHAQGTVTFTEFPIPTSNSTPNYITKGPDGNLWFTEEAGSKIGKITPSGTVTEFQVSTSQTNPFGITAGPDGNLWFTEEFTSKIGKITPSGTITEYPISGNPYGITAGPDGNVWFTEDGNTIGRITPSGTITEFPLPSSGNANQGITAGPDGNIWFTVYSPNQIGRITPSGTITEFPGAAGGGPVGITAGPDGNLWFTEQVGNTIGKITTSGVVTQYSVPTSSSFLEGITNGPDGNLWFAEGNGNKIGQITPTGNITEFPIPTSNSAPNGITTGPDGNVWFTEYLGNKIGRVNLASPTPTVTVQKVWIADGNNNVKTSFAPGDAIHYRAQVNNTSSTTVTATFTFLAKGPQQIFSWSGSQSVAAGTSSITQASTVPVNALKGTYTLTVTVTYSGQNSMQSSSFTVTPKLQSYYNYIWSGYVVEGTTASPVTYTDVKGSWTVPTAQCSLGETSRAAIWVGIGGIVGDTYLEQIGTSADCNVGIPHYWVWYEMFPNNPVPINCGSGLKANDKVSLAEVTSLGGGNFSLAIDTPECSFQITQTQQGAELNSAEWIVEDPPGMGCTPQCLLTHFVTGTKPLINFSSCSANGNPITANPLLWRYVMTSDGTSKGTLKASPLNTTSGDTAFSDKWFHS